MALVRFNNGERESKLTPESGAELWSVLNGETEGNEKQQAFCEKVSKVYLNWHNAPDSYIRERLDIIAPMVMSSWMVKGWKTADGKLVSDGTVTRPEPSDLEGWAFGKKWGLLKNGQLTDLGRRYASGKQSKNHPW